MLDQQTISDMQAAAVRVFVPQLVAQVLDYETPLAKRFAWPPVRQYQLEVERWQDDGGV